MNKKKPSKGSIWKDIIIYSVIVSLLVYICILTFKDVEDGSEVLDRITQYVGVVVTILLGVLGIIEFAYDNGLSVLVPCSYENYKERKLMEQTKHYLHEFFRNEAEYFSQHSNSRIAFLLNQLGLSRNQFEQLKMDVLEIKLLPLHNLDDAKQKMMNIIRNGDVILIQDGKSTDDLVYKEVTYFLNFTDVLFEEDYYPQIIDCMTFLIKEGCKANNMNFNRILVTNRGNFLLGLGISQKMNVPMVKVTEKPMILNSKSWIGNFSENESDASIIVHDVLVSGAQLEESMKIVGSKTKITGIFCLVNRLDYEGREKLATEYGIPIFSLLDLKDEDIEKLRS